MKVLFLDMDGVVNSEAGHKAGLFKTHFPVDSYMAFLVGKIQLDTDCKVVLSSSWRHHDESVAQINKQLVPLLDITPTIRRPTGAGIEWCERGREIKQWLDTHKDYDITKYAILDDENDMLPEQQENFFKTSWEEGLTPEIAEKIIKHLNE